MEIERGNVTRLLNERLEIHDNSRKAVQDKLSEICCGMRKQIDDFEDSINSELGEVFDKEDKRLQDALHNINESVSLEELTKAIQRPKVELLLMQSYELIQDNSSNSANNDNDNDDNNEINLNKSMPKRSKLFSLLDFTRMYKLKTERKFTSLKIIDFEEKKPTNIETTFTNKGRLSLSFTFFNDDEINVLKAVSNSSFNVEIKMWDKTEGGEENSKMITKEFYVEEKQQFYLVESFNSNSTYCMTIRIEYQELSSKWSDEIEFTTPESKNFCAWRECPDYVDEKRKYFVDENNPRISTKIGDNDYYCTIIGNALIPHNKVTSWNIKILKSSLNDGNGIYVGVAPFDINQNDDNFYKCGWYFNCRNSTLWSGPPHNYVCKEYGPRKKPGKYVHTGDKVGVVMDTTKGDLSFALNEVNLGVAYEGIPLDKPLVPCVILYHKGDSVELVI